MYSLVPPLAPLDAHAVGRPCQQLPNWAVGQDILFVSERYVAFAVGACRGQHGVAWSDPVITSNLSETVSMGVSSWSRLLVYLQRQDHVAIGGQLVLAS